jgi:hypothetical protein
MPTGDRGDPFNSMNFVVEIEGIPRSAFLAVSGIEADVAVVDYRPGNDKVPGARKLPGGHCQLERKYAHRLKVADCHSVIFGPQKRASRPITPTRSFPSNAPILPQLDNAAEDPRRVG